MRDDNSERERGWCFYVLDMGGSLRDGFKSPEDALDEAVVFFGDEMPNELSVGTSIDPQTRMRFDANIIAEGIAEDLEVEDCDTYLLDGAQEALDAWVREYVRSEARSICVDGRMVTVKEWADAVRRVAEKLEADDA